MEALFLEALEQPRAARAAWLAARDAEADVLAEVARMLDADAALDTSVGATGGASPAEPGIEPPPRGLEPYRALYAVREGPQASVYLGVHADPEAGFVRRVAIKVVRQAADADLRARFERERRLLAALRHPNIAPLLDGGTTTDGRPYLVMPFVDGTPIDTYCRDQALDLEARVGLFRSVCAAVHHAHQNLVVHRDLKPSNVLVDGDGVPKLLDFGIAKPLNPELTDAALVTTQPSFRPMTPRYASPEQVGGGAITTASDVYSLGVMLHELLTGRPPYALDDRAPAAVAHAIVHEEPPPTGLPRDLDAIVRKAFAQGARPAVPVGGGLGGRPRSGRAPSARARPSGHAGLSGTTFRAASPGGQRLGRGRRGRGPGDDGANGARARRLIPQLADVARPVVVFPLAQQIHRDPIGVAAAIGPESSREQLDVLLALAEWWQLDARDGEAMEQVVAEAPLLHHSIEITASGCDHTHVDADGLRPADAPHLIALDHTQKARLQRERQIADFIDEQRATIGLLEHAAMRANGAGERALFVAEELGLDQGRSHCRAVEHDEWPLGTPAHLMQRFRRAALCRCRFRLR